MIIFVKARNIALEVNIKNLEGENSQVAIIDPN
jgi:hypothetical protein